MSSLPQTFAVVSCWLVISAYAAVVAFGIRLAITGAPDDPTGPLNTIGTGLAALVAAVVAAAVAGQAVSSSILGIDSKNLLLVVYVVVYMVAGVASLVIYLWKSKATPTIIRTIATSLVGLVIGSAAAYWKVPALFG